MAFFVIGARPLIPRQRKKRVFLTRFFSALRFACWNGNLFPIPMSYRLNVGFGRRCAGQHSAGCIAKQPFGERICTSLLFVSPSLPSSSASRERFWAQTSALPVAAPQQTSAENRRPKPMSAVRTNANQDLPRASARNPAPCKTTPPCLTARLPKTPARPDAPRTPVPAAAQKAAPAARAATKHPEVSTANHALAFSICSSEDAS